MNSDRAIRFGAMALLLTAGCATPPGSSNEGCSGLEWVASATGEMATGYNVTARLVNNGTSRAIVLRLVPQLTVDAHVLDGEHRALPIGSDRAIIDHPPIRNTTLVDLPAGSSESTQFGTGEFASDQNASYLRVVYGPRRIPQIEEAYCTSTFYEDLPLSEIPRH